MSYEDEVAAYWEAQIYRLKQGWGYGKRTKAENRQLASAAGDSAREIAGRHPFAQEVQPIPRRLITTLPPNAPVETVERWERAMAMTPGWEHVARVCSRKDSDEYLDANLFPLTEGLWPAVRSGSQLSDLIRMEELLSRGGVYIDADVELLAPIDRLLDYAWLPGENRTDPPDVSTFAMAFWPGHPGLAAFMELALSIYPGPTWWTSVGAMRAVFYPRFGTDTQMLVPETLCPVYWKDIPELERVYRMTPDEFRYEFPHSLGIHLYEGSWRSGKSRRTEVDKGGH